MVLFGRPLIQRIEAKNAAEARLRTEMVRVRVRDDNAVDVVQPHAQRPHVVA